MGLDPALVDHPPEHLGRSIGRVAGQPLQVKVEALLGALNHRHGHRSFGLTNRGRGLHIDDDGAVQIDEVVGAIGEESLPTREHPSSAPPDLAAR